MLWSAIRLISFWIGINYYYYYYYVAFFDFGFDPPPPYGLFPQFVTFSFANAPLTQQSFLPHNSKHGPAQKYVSKWPPTPPPASPSHKYNSIHLLDQRIKTDVVELKPDDHKIEFNHIIVHDQHRLGKV